MRRRILVWLCLVVFCLIIILPPIIHGYVYPNIGDDTAAHMNILDKIGFFSSQDVSPVEQIRYGAIYIVGYPLDIINHFTGIDKDVLFLWFNYLALIGVGLSLFFVFKNLINFQAGLLALIIPIFTSYGMLLLFYSGVIFEIINIGIILPFACYFAIKWQYDKSKRYAIGAICLFALFTVFHSTGIYLPFILVATFVTYIIYKLVKKQPISKKITILGFLALACMAVVLIFFNSILGTIWAGMDATNIKISGLTLLSESLFRYMSPFLITIILLSGALLYSDYKHILPKEKYTILTFGLLALVMLPAMLFGWSPQPFRQGLDFAIFLSMGAVALLGVIIRLGRYRVVTYGLTVLAIGGSVFNIGNWFGYNSALEKVDIRAIDYINSLDGEYYSCSDNVDHWVYGRYVDKEYLPLGGEILVTRNVPMKSKVALVEDDDLTSGRAMVGKLIDGDVEILIYR